MSSYFDDLDRQVSDLSRQFPRAEAYVAKHGRHSWEVDALPPNVLQAIIRKALDAVVDRSLMDPIIEREKKHREALKRAAKRLEQDR